MQKLLSVLLLFTVFSCTKEKELLSLEGRTMGTSFSVKLVKDDPTIAYDRIEADINNLLVEVNRQMSTYLPDSELSLFNTSRDSGWFAVSPDFARVVEEALLISQDCDGAFDITVGPLVNLWGFGPDPQTSEIPSDEEIEGRKKFVGFTRLAVRQTPPAVRKGIPEIYCDLSAIAKGFGVDKVSEYLEGINVNDYMVEIGGEVRTKGLNHQNSAWRIGVNSPDLHGLQKILNVTDIAMATSGDYFNYFEKDGVRYSHTINPRTGRPISHKLASVTVLHKSCMVADGLATAIDVLGPETGYAFAEQRELPVYMIIRENGGFVEKMTPGFLAKF